MVATPRFEKLKLFLFAVPVETPVATECE